MEKIKVEVKFEFEHTPGEGEADVDLEPSFVIFDIKREGKDGYESTVKIPVGDVPAKDFAKGAKVLQLVALSFYHQMYLGLKKKLEELNSDG